MPDREKVISEFERWCDEMEDECPMICLHALVLLKKQQELIEDMKTEIEVAEENRKLLLKEQEVEPFHKCMGDEYTLIEDSGFDYCPYCGKKVKWE